MTTPRQPRSPDEALAELDHCLDGLGAARHRPRRTCSHHEEHLQDAVRSRPPLRLPPVRLPMLEPLLLRARRSSTR